jgi:carbon monoxide dehydrogenase subunit G
VTAVTASIDIAAPPQRVWDVVMDPHHFDEWVTIHRKLGHVDGGELRRGFEVEQTLSLHHANFKVRWRLTELEPPHHAVWLGRGPAGSHARTGYRLTELDEGAQTRFDYQNEYSQPGGFLGRVAGRVFVAGAAEREANRSLARLKAYVEGSPDAGGAR